MTSRNQVCPVVTLLDSITVGISSPLLARLEEITRHRLIKKGIRRISLNLSYYSPFLASDIVRFASYHINRLTTEIEHLPLMLAHGHLEETVESVRDTVSKAHDILASWAGYLNNAPDAVENSRSSQKHIKLLQRAYSMYCRRLSDQRRLIAQGTFNRKLALALAKMPLARKLNYKSSWIYQKPIGSLCYQLGDNKALLQRLVLPSSNDDAEGFYFDTTPAEMCLSVPLAMLNVGVFLVNVEIYGQCIEITLSSTRPRRHNNDSSRLCSI